MTPQSMTDQEYRPTHAAPIYESGELVDLTIRDARVQGGDGAGVLIEVGGHRLFIPITEGVTVVRTTPVAGMPQPGDVWIDATGELWLAVSWGERKHCDLIPAARGPQYARSVAFVHSGPTGPLRLHFRSDSEGIYGEAANDATP